MNRRMATVLVAVALGATGCGVPNKEFRAQVVRTEALEARSADLEARLARKEAEKADLDTALAAALEQQAQLGRQLAGAEAHGAEAADGLEGCLEREADLRADLDVCRKARGATEGDLDAARKRLEREREAWAARRQGLEDEIEALRGRISDRDARLSVLAEERRRVEQEKREKLEELQKTYGGLVEGLKQEVEAGRVTIRNLEGRLSVNLLDEILFDSGSAVVKKGGRAVLRSLAEAIRGVPDRDVVIEGHTDSVPIRGGAGARFPTNWELSAARATSVVRYLEGDGRIPGEHLAAVGFGPYRPVATNDTPEGRARNRRIEVKLVPRAPSKGERGGAPGTGGRKPGAGNQ